MAKRTRASLPGLMPTHSVPQPERAHLRLDRRRLLRQALAAGFAPAAIAGVSVADAAAAPGRQAWFKGGYGTMIVSIGGDPASFNPNLHADSNAFVPACSIFSRLVALDADYNILPDLAERWTIADDGLTYTFQLARGANWHDDEPVTAADVKYTLDQLRAMEDVPAHRWLAPITAVETPNDRTVVLTLSTPSASLLAALAYERTFILPAHRYRDTDWSTNPDTWRPIGSGPFRFLSYTPGATIDLETYYDYFGSGPDLDRLIFQIMPDPAAAVEALRHGEIDLIVSPAPIAQLPALRQEPTIAIGEQALATILFLGFNLDREPVSSPAARRALAQALDRQQMAEQGLAGMATPATTFVPEVMAWAVADDDAFVPTLDTATAAATLDAAGFPLAGDARLRLVFPYPVTDATDERIAALIGEQLRPIGVATELVGLEPDAWRERLQNGDFDITLMSASLGPDPITLRDYVGTDGEANHWRFSNEAIDALFIEGEATAGKEARAAVYREVQKLLSTELPLIPVVAPVAVYPYSERASGFFFGDARGEVGLNQFTEARLDQQEQDSE